MMTVLLFTQAKSNVLHMYCASTILTVIRDDIELLGHVYSTQWPNIIYLIEFSLHIYIVSFLLFSSSFFIYFSNFLLPELLLIFVCVFSSHLYRNLQSYVHPQAIETGTAPSACRQPASQSRPTVAICSVVRYFAHTHTRGLFFHSCICSLDHLLY